MNRAEAALAVWRAGVVGADPEAAVRRHLRWVAPGVLGAGRHSVGTSGKIWLVGAGKAAAGMAAGVAAVVPDLAGRAIVAPLSPLSGGHPLPDASSVAAADRVARLVSEVPASDLVIAVWSGGGSSMLGAPIDGLDLADVRDIVAALLRSGASIHEINAVRRRILALAGGRLRARSRAPVLTLALSDVFPGAKRTIRDGEALPWADDPLHLAAIASGPTVPDPTSRQDAADILARYGLDRFRYALAADEAVPRGPSLVVGGPDSALHAASHRARELGWAPVVLDAAAVDPAEAVAQRVARAVRGAEGGPPIALLVAGETPVIVQGTGLGGRAQHAAAVLASELEGVAFSAVIAGTDGIDGPTSAAGGRVDGDTCARARVHGVDPVESLVSRDSSRLLAAADALLATGPTGTNAGDLWVALVGAP